MHKSFKPKMTGGIDQSSVGMSPEAHKEWSAKGGKHVINGAAKAAPKAAPVPAAAKGAKKIAPGAPKVAGALKKPAAPLGIVKTPDKFPAKANKKGFGGAGK